MISDIEAILWLAKRDSNIWRQIIGCNILHKDEYYGIFLVEELQENAYLVVRSAKHGKKIYSIDTIHNYFKELIFPDTKKELKRLVIDSKREREQEGLLIELRNKYSVPRFKDFKISKQIDEIIHKIGINKILNKDEEKMLFDNKLFLTLAKYHEELIKNGKGYEWSIPKAGKYWRYAQNPKRSLEVTDIKIENNNKLNSAIYANRGAAFLDLGLHEKSEECARISIKYDDSGCCPYNLLGSIYLDIGNIEKAIEYFDKAKDKFGYNKQEQALDIREIIKKIRDRNEVDKEKLIVQHFKHIIARNRKIEREYDGVTF